MSFFDSISQFFGFGGSKPEGTWPRKVATNELPPSRLPIIPAHLRGTLPFGIREPCAAWQGWLPWKPPLEHERSAGSTMTDFLHDGFVPPPPDRD
jgi:hypothetical protein